MGQELLPAKEVVRSWCYGHQTPGQIQRLMQMISTKELMLLLWMYPRNRYSQARLELMDRFFLESKTPLPPLLHDLFCEELRDSMEAIDLELTKEIEDPLIKRMLIDRGAELAYRQGDIQEIARFEEILGENRSDVGEDFFSVKHHMRRFEFEVSTNKLAKAKESLATFVRESPHVIGYDIFACCESILRLHLETAEGAPESLSGYLALQQDSRLFAHQRAMITMHGAKILSLRQQYASSISLWLELLHGEDHVLPPRLQRSAALSLSQDLIHGGEYDAAIVEIKRFENLDKSDKFTAHCQRLEALARVHAGDLHLAQSLIHNFVPLTASSERKWHSLDVFVRVCALRAQGSLEAALAAAVTYCDAIERPCPNDPWLSQLARERLRILREIKPDNKRIVPAAEFAIHVAALAQDPASLRDIYFILAMYYADDPKTCDQAVEACRDAERCARTIMETLRADRDVLFQVMPADNRHKTVVSALLGRLSENARRGLSNLFELIRSLVRQAHGANKLLAALRESQRRIARIFETLPIVFWTSFGAAQNFALCRADGAVLEVLGTPAEGLTTNATAWLDTIDNRDWQSVIEALRNVELTLGGKTVEFRRQESNGVVKWIELQIRPVIGESHDDGALYGIMSDVTARHELQQTIIQNQKTDLLNLLVNNITHEFNNVVGGILGAATLLNQTIDKTDENLELVDAIERSALRGRDLTARLSALTNETSGLRTNVNLVSAVEDAVELARSMVAPSIQLQVISWDDSLPVLMARDALTRCLLDLIRNAEEAAPSDLCITVRSARENDSAVITVEDQGCGMSREVSAHATAPFFSTKDKNQHRGLGLTMVDKIARECSAKLTFTSEEESGTVMKLTFPLYAGPIESVPSDKAKSLLRSRGGRLLVIDDDQEILRISSRILKNAGFDVVTAGDGQAGIEAFDQDPASWSLVISDIRMPRMDGFGVVRNLRQKDPTLPILMMTGFSETSPLTVVDKDEYVALIRKPFTASSFLEQAALLLLKSDAI